MPPEGLAELRCREKRSYALSSKSPSKLEKSIKRDKMNEDVVRANTFRIRELKAFISILPNSEGSYSLKKLGTKTSRSYGQLMHEL
jgi:hypothetical protein